MRKTIAALGIFTLLFLGFGFSALAQTADDTADVRTADDDDGPDLGWLGLLGLAGLLGLRRPRELPSRSRQPGVDPGPNVMNR
jgi:MYXO-CTERM domain-containing protein